MLYLANLKYKLVRGKKYWNIWCLMTQEPKSIGKILDGGLKFLPILAKQLLLLLVIVTVLQTLQNLQRIFPGGAYTDIIVIASFIIAIPFYLYLYFAQILLASNAWLGKEVSLQAIKKRIKFSLVWRLLLLTLRIMLITALGLLLLVIPGIVYAINRILSYYVLIIEDCSVSEALNKSKFLMTQGRWYQLSSPPMRITGLYLIVMMISLIASLFVGGGAAMGLLGFASILSTAILAIGVFIANVAGIFNFLCMVGFYHDLCARYEGADLISQIENLEI